MDKNSVQVFNHFVMSGDISKHFRFFLLAVGAAQYCIEKVHDKQAQEELFMFLRAKSDKIGLLENINILYKEAEGNWQQDSIISDLDNACKLLGLETEVITSSNLSSHRI